MAVSAGVMLAATILPTLITTGASLISQHKSNKQMKELAAKAEVSKKETFAQMMAFNQQGNASLARQMSALMPGGANAMSQVPFAGPGFYPPGM